MYVCSICEIMRTVGKLEGHILQSKSTTPWPLHWVHLPSRCKLLPDFSHSLYRRASHFTTKQRPLKRSPPSLRIPVPHKHHPQHTTNRHKNHPSHNNHRASSFLLRSRGSLRISTQPLPFPPLPPSNPPSRHPSSTPSRSRRHIRIQDRPVRSLYFCLGAEQIEHEGWRGQEVPAWSAVGGVLPS